MVTDSGIPTACRPSAEGRRDEAFAFSVFLPRIGRGVMLIWVVEFRVILWIFLQNYGGCSVKLGEKGIPYQKRDELPSLSLLSFTRTTVAGKAISNSNLTTWNQSAMPVLIAGCGG